MNRTTRGLRPVAAALTALAAAVASLTLIPAAHAATGTAATPRGTYYTAVTRTVLEGQTYTGCDHAPPGRWVRMVRFTTPTTVRFLTTNGRMVRRTVAARTPVCKWSRDTRPPARPLPYIPPTTVEVIAAACTPAGGTTFRIDATWRLTGGQYGVRMPDGRVYTSTPGVPLIIRDSLVTDYHGTDPRTVGEGATTAFTGQFHPSGSRPNEYGVYPLVSWSHYQGEFDRC